MEESDIGIRGLGVYGFSWSQRRMQHLSTAAWNVGMPCIRDEGPSFEIGAGHKPSSASAAEGLGFRVP